MKIKSDFNTCILCLKNPADSWEHIIPHIIGGRLQAQVLCTDCNNNLGSKLISKIKTDPSIRLAVRNLKPEIPELYEAIEQDQLYISKNENNSIIELRYKNSKLEIIPNKKENGSLVIDTKKGIKNIEQMLRKDGLSEDEIAEKIQSFQELENNRIMQLSKTFKVVKRPIDTMFPSLQGKLLDEKVIALMAYEFLSLLIGNLIYDYKFDFIRKFIREGKTSEKLVIEGLRSRQYDTYHKIYPELLEKEIIINIILFGWLWYKVHFKGFNLKSADPVYLEDLKNKMPLISLSVDEAKQGIYHEF